MQRPTVSFYPLAFVLTLIFSGAPASLYAEGVEPEKATELILEVDHRAVVREIYENLVDDVRALLRRHRIRYRELGLSDNGVQVKILKKERVELALERLSSLAAVVRRAEDDPQRVVLAWDDATIEAIRGPMRRRAMHNVRLVSDCMAKALNHAREAIIHPSQDDPYRFSLTTWNPPAGTPLACQHRYSGWPHRKPATFHQLLDDEPHVVSRRVALSSRSFIRAIAVADEAGTAMIKLTQLIPGPEQTALEGRFALLQAGEILAIGDMQTVESGRSFVFKGLPSLEMATEMADLIELTGPAAPLNILSEKVVTFPGQQTE